MSGTAPDIKYLSVCPEAVPCAEAFDPVKVADAALEALTGKFPANKGKL